MESNTTFGWWVQENRLPYTNWRFTWKQIRQQHQSSKINLTNTVRWNFFFFFFLLNINSLAADRDVIHLSSNYSNNNKLIETKRKEKKNKCHVNVYEPHTCFIQWRRLQLIIWNELCTVCVWTAFEVKFQMIELLARLQ